jgi:hypothetical protein
VAGPVLLFTELSFQHVQDFGDGSVNGRVHVACTILGSDARPTGQMHFDGTARIETALGAVHVLEIDLDTAQTVAKARADGRFDIGSNRFRKFFAVLDVIVSAHLKDHGIPRSRIQKFDVMKK